MDVIGYCISNVSRETLEGNNDMDNYKLRFINESNELLDRINKLRSMLDGYKEGTLPFTPVSSYDLLHSQLVYMTAYYNILVTRSAIEGINITVNKEG